MSNLSCERSRIISRCELAYVIPYESIGGEEGSIQIDKLEREEDKKLSRQCIRVHGRVEVTCLGSFPRDHQMSGMCAINSE